MKLTLKWLLALWFAAMLSLTGSLMAVGHYQETRHALEADEEERLRLESNVLLISLEALLGKGFVIEARDELGLMSARSGMRYVVVLDSNGRVLLSSRRAWQDRPASEIPELTPHLEAENFQRAGQGLTQVGTGAFVGDFQLALAPEPGSIRPRWGRLLFHSESAGWGRRIAEHLAGSLPLQFASLLVGTGILLFGLGRWFFRPLGQLSERAAHLLDGDSTALDSLPPASSRELHALQSSLRELAWRLERRDRFLLALGDLGRIDPGLIRPEFYHKLLRDIAEPQAIGRLLLFQRDSFDRFCPLARWPDTHPAGSVQVQALSTPLRARLEKREVIVLSSAERGDAVWLPLEMTDYPIVIAAIAPAERLEGLLIACSGGSGTQAGWSRMEQEAVQALANGIGGLWGMQGFIAFREAANEQLSSILDALNEGIVGLQADGRIAFINRAAAELLGLASPEVALNKHFAALVSLIEEDSHWLAQAPTPAASNAPEERRSTLARLDGARFPARLRRLPMAGAIQVLSFSDISQSQVVEQERLLADIVFSHVREGVLITDAQGHILRANPTLCRLMGYEANEIYGRTPALFRSGRQDVSFYRVLWDILLQDGHWEGEIWNRTRDGRLIPFWENIQAVRDASGEIAFFVALLTDISAIKENARELERLAYHDALTGLPNRELLRDRVGGALSQSRRHGTYGALLFIDLDHFKHINDTHGHDIGDAFLVAVAQEFTHLVREEDTVARLGGDEFAVLVAGLDPVLEHAADEARRVARKMVERMKSPLEVQGLELSAGCSVGIALFGPSGEEDFDALLKQADTAMYQVKAAGRGGIAFFGPELHAQVNTRERQEKLLELAIAQGAFELAFQPQIQLGNGEARLIECFVRWQHPSDGLLQAEGFIELAENIGLVPSIDTWMLEAVLEHMQLVHDRHSLLLSLNLSDLTLRDPSLLSRLTELFERRGWGEMHLDGLVIEHSAELAVSEYARPVLDALQQAGALLTVDDFGRGEVSVAQLAAAPIRRVKIDDRRFAALPDGRRAELAALALAQTLGYDVTLSRIEDAERLAFARSHGVRAAQGNALCPVLDEAGLAEWLSSLPAVED